MDLPMKKTKSLYLILVFLCPFVFFVKTINAQTKNPSPIVFPTPKNVENILFFLQRDPNTNTLIYALNLEKNGSVNRTNPIRVYWIRYAENSEKKELSYIQRKFAYGIDTREISNGNYELRFVSHKKLPMYLHNAGSKNYYVTVSVNNKTIKINRLFIRIEGGSFWLPNVKYAQIDGTDESSGKPVVERVSIK